MKDKKVMWIGAAILGWFFVIWLGFLIAPTLGYGISVMVDKIGRAHV